MKSKRGLTGRVLSTYSYDPLDRLSRSGRSDEVCQKYYLENRLANEVRAGIQRTVIQMADVLLAEHIQDDAQGTQVLLATTEQKTVIKVLSKSQSEAFQYTAYGYHVPSDKMDSLLKFNGERPDDVTGHYLLGHGYRAFNPVLMRFNSPDDLSPFGNGGLNAYAYCAADPVNRVDPDGHVYHAAVLKAAGKFLSKIGRQPRFAMSAPRLTHRPPNIVKAQRTPERLIANLEDSSPLKALPEERLAPTPREWYILEGSRRDLLKHHRRYVRSSREMLRDKRSSIKRQLNEQESYSSPMAVDDAPVFSAKSEALSFKIAEQRKQAGRTGAESLLGQVTDIRKGHRLI